jgi:hypothetical protein
VEEHAKNKALQGANLLPAASKQPEHFTGPLVSYVFEHDAYGFVNKGIAFTELRRINLPSFSLMLISQVEQLP